MQIWIGWGFAAQNLYPYLKVIFPKIWTHFKGFFWKLVPISSNFATKTPTGMEFLEKNGTHVKGFLAKNRSILTKLPCMSSCVRTNTPRAKLASVMSSHLFCNYMHALKHCYLGSLLKRNWPTFPAFLKHTNLLTILKLTNTKWWREILHFHIMK